MEKSVYDDRGLMIVKENYCCEHWEPNDEVLVPMRECWCCKWSNFRADNKNSSSECFSVCNYVGNAQEAISR